MRTNKDTATAFVEMQEATGSNLISLGSTCVSYRTIIASHQNGIILLTSHDYSNTTQRYKLHIRRAANAQRVTVFEVPECYNWNGLTKEQHQKNISYLLDEAETMRAKADRARTYKAYYRELEEKYRKTAEDYINTFNL